MTGEVHGAGCQLRNSGNDGSAQIEEDATGRVTIRIYGNALTLANVVVYVNDEPEMVNVAARIARHLAPLRAVAPFFLSHAKDSRRTQ